MIATPPKSDTPTTTPTNSERVFIPRGESPHFSVLLPETLHVSPTGLRDLIVEGTEDADIAIFLVIVNGLPYCRKSEVFRKLLTSLVPKADELIPKADEHRPAHGLSHYELAAVGQPEPHCIHKPALGYSAITSEDCYLYAMKSAMTQVGGTSLIKYEEGDGLPAGKKFKHEGLNVHLHDMFSQLKSNEKISSMGIRGVALFNVWDIGHSRTVYHFLPALHGLLNHSYSWLFFDLQRDSQNLYKPLNRSTPDKPSSNADENVMKFKPRLHYLIRHAQLNLPAKEKVCSILAVNNSSNSDAQNIADLLKPDFENAAAKIGVKENIDFDAVMVIQPDKNEELIKDKLDVLIKKELRSKRNVPFSFLFLRSFYYKNDAIVYIKKEEVKQLAVELNISDQKFKEFCELFTSCGSIVDVSLIDKHSKYIIMKPNLFLKEIDEIYHTKDKTLANTGILTLSAAEEMFGLRANAYMEILVSLSLAVELTREQVELPDSINDKVWYLPDSRTTPPCEDTTELRPTVLRLLRSLNAPPGHLQTSFVSEFLKISEGSKVCVPEDKSYPNNITKIIAFDNITETTVAIKFDVVYLGYTLEFRIDTANEKIFSHIIETCHKVMEHQHHKETTYNFAILCSKNPRSTSAGAKYELTRERHFLPYATTLCDKCKSDERHKNPILDMWNKVVEVSRVIHLYSS